MLSFTNGRPIAKIKGGEYNGKILNIDTEPEKQNKSKDKKEKKYSSSESDTESYSEEYECGCSKCDPRKCLKKACCDDCPYIEYSDEENESSSDSESTESSSKSEEIDLEINIEDGSLVPVPNIDSREVVYIAGPAGSGKSTYASLYLENYKKLFPKNDIIIFSRKPSDPVLDRLKPCRFVIDESIVTNPLDITQDLTDGCCVLFDDTNTFQDDKIKRAVAKLMHDILEIGRSLEVYCVITSHLINPNERKDARTIWNEAHTVTIFPKSGNRHGIKYALQNYCGFDRKDIEKILKLPSRWVTIGKQYPLYIMHEHGAYIN